MANVSNGVCIVRLRTDNAVDYCVVVDGLKKEIVYSEEKKPKRLCKASLCACGGDDCVDLYFAEVRELYKSS